MLSCPRQTGWEIVTRYIALLVLCVGLAGIVPHYFEGYLAEWRQSAPPAAAGRMPVSAASEPAASEASYLGNGRTVTLEADRSGHFSGTFRINGRTVAGLIDTGATYVAMNATTARRLGISPARADYVYPVQTANGVTKAARTTLDRVEIGPIRVEDVAAFVLDDAAISETLIGMSFLRKLQSYRVRDGVLDLRG